MKKKKTIWIYVKRVFLIAILVIAVTILSVFFLGKYKVSGTDYQNEFSDAFWNSLSGFKHVDEYKEEVNGANFNSQYYSLPYDEASVTDPIEKCKACRYQEEVDYIVSTLSEKEQSEIRTQANSIKVKLPTWKNYSLSLAKRVVLDNENYEMTMNVLNTTFEIKDKKNGVVWYSNPSENEMDSPAGINKIQQSILNLTYINSSKAETPIPTLLSSYSNSTNDDVQSRRTANFYLKIDEESQQVIVYYVYTEGGIDYTSFPERISGARMRELLQRSYDLAHSAAEEGNVLFDTNSIPEPRVICGFATNQRQLNVYAANGKNNTKIVDEERHFTGKDYFYANELKVSIFGQIYKAFNQDGTAYVGGPTGEGNLYNGDADYYEFTSKPENLSKNNLNALYRFFYDWCGYTEEDLAIDNGNKEVSNGKPELRAAIVYQLTEEGLKVTVPGNSIKGNSDNRGNEYHVVSIDVLPYFTCAKTGAYNGYALIPDGSGAIMEFDNQKANYPAYSKRIYSSDLAFTSYTLTSQTTDILLPMYAYIYSNSTDKSNKKSNVAVIAEATKGASQMVINAYTAGQANGANSFNYAHYSIIFREAQQVVFGTSTYNRVNIKQYTRKAATGDYAINYDFVKDEKEDTVDYSYIAKIYQEKLVSRSNRVSLNNDKTNEAVLDLEIIGQYTYNDNILGIKYTGKDTLTTIEELDIILSKILENNATTSMNVYYKGWRKEGLSNVSFKNIKVSNKIGGRKELLNLINESKTKNINIYPEVEFLEYNKYQESFGNNHYTARDIGGSYAIKKEYELNTNIFNKKKPNIMVLSPNYYLAFANTLAKNYSKVLKGVDSIALTGLGSQLSGSYRRNKEVFKYTALEEQIKSFEALEAQGITKVALEAPYGYAIGYASNAYNVPVESSKQEILDYSVPFYQLVMNGLFDYSGTSINEGAEKGITEQIMKCIESGANPSFTFTYDNTSELLQTDYNNYYYTYYERWLSDVTSICKELNATGIYECNFVSHQRIDNNVYKVIYRNKTNPSQQIEIVLNYQRIPWTGIVNGNVVSVETKSYSIINTYKTA